MGLSGLPSDRGKQPDSRLLTTPGLCVAQGLPVPTNPLVRDHYARPEDGRRRPTEGRPRVSCADLYGTLVTPRVFPVVYGDLGNQVGTHLPLWNYLLWETLLSDGATSVRLSSAGHLNPLPR